MILMSALTRTLPLRPPVPETKMLSALTPGGDGKERGGWEQSVTEERDAHALMDLGDV